MLQELRALRETREGLEDQIERLQWALTQEDHRTPADASVSSTDEEDEDAMRAVCLHTDFPKYVAQNLDAVWKCYACGVPPY